MAAIKKKSIRLTCMHCGEDFLATDIGQVWCVLCWFRRLKKIKKIKKMLSNERIS